MGIQNNITKTGAWGLIGLLFLSVQVVYGQQGAAPTIEVIVRPDESKGSTLLQTLRSGVIPKNSDDSLFANVRGISPVFRSPKGTQKTVTEGLSPPISAFRLTVRDSSSFRQLRNRWERHPGVRYAHANHEFTISGAKSSEPSLQAGPILSDDNMFADSLNHLGVIRALDSWSITTGRSDVVIGVIDTGFYLNHPDLQDQFWTNDGEQENGQDDDGNGYVDDVIGYDFVDRSAPLQEGDFEERDPDPSADPKGDGSWHGTAVSAVATAFPENPEAGIAGVAPDTRLMALRAFGGDGRGESDDIAAAIVYGATMGADVLNLSFGRGRAVPLIEEAIEFANDQGTIVVGSAGNELTDDPHYPSDYPEVLSVVWLAEDGQGLPQFNRSQFGIGVDLGTPGTNVFTANFPAQQIESGEEIRREDLYRSASGSSFSTPQVAAAAALLRSADSTLSPASVRSILTGTASDLEDESWDHRTGAGLLDVTEALERAYPARTEITTPDHNQGLTEKGIVPVVGTALDPDFESYAVSFAKGTKDLDDRAQPWTEITPPTDSQVLRDTLGLWDLSSLEEGEYTLRLVTRLRDGRTIEDRRRILIDRTPPEIDVQFLGSGRIEGSNGVVADLWTDDLTRMEMRVQIDGRTAKVKSEHRARRQGLSWSDSEGTGGEAKVRITAENTSGLRTSIDTTIQVPKSEENTALLQRSVTSVPTGRLLPKAPDFDGDGLRELVLNESRQGALTDTLRSFEWAGDGFAPADTLVASLFPKDVGDTNEDGLQELLLQVRGATLLLEQRTPTSFPDSLVFADTTGGNDQSGDHINGARLTDVDSDGRGEILGTTGDAWKVLERSASGFEEILQLGNPTAPNGRDSALANAFDVPEAVSRDFDGDGRRDVLVGDRDGDLIVYEAMGNDDMEVVWTQETDRVDAGNRFGTGDLNGDGTSEFVTMATFSQQELEDEGEFEPPISYYSIWRHDGDDEYVRGHLFPVVGPYSKQGTISAADVDGDGRDEVAIVHPPSLFILDRTDSGRWRVLHENRDQPPIRTRGLVAADFSGSGFPSLIASTVGENVLRFTVDEEAVSVPPPRWVRARPTGASSVRLTWRAPAADSVEILAGEPDEELDRVATTTDSVRSISGSSTRRFALRALKDGTLSPLSSHRTLRPHAPATLMERDYPDPSTVRLTFTERLSSDTDAEQFALGEERRTPTRLVQPNNGRSIDLQFPEEVTGLSARLRWKGVEDEEGLAVGDTAATVSFPSADRRSLFVEKATILDPRRVRLAFNEPLARSMAEDEDRYDVRPRGRVAYAEIEGESSKTVTLQMEGLVIGARGDEASLTVTDVVSTSGNRLAEEGRTVRLTKPADDLSNVFVYPNPYREQEHGEGLTIAGLPKEATVHIYTPDGRLVRELSVENNRNGGEQWDLRDRRGDRVPSGVYLIRVNAPEQSSVLEKAAVIR